MNIIDSSVLISYFRHEEENHQKACQFIDSLSDMVLSDYVLLEIATVLMIRENKNVAKKAIDFMTHNKDITIIRLNQNEFADTVSFFLNNKSSLSFVDISLLILKKHRQGNVYTFDKKFNTEVKQQKILNY